MSELRRLGLPKYGYLLEQCCTIKNTHSVRQVHAQTVKIGISYDDFIRNRLVSAYASCSEICDAHYIFSLSNRQNTFLYNTLIKGYASAKQFRQSLDCFREMMYRRREINRHTLPVVLKSVAALSVLRVGKVVHGCALIRGFGSDLSHCNSLISMYGKCGDLFYARKVFNDMPEKNLVTWSAIMGAYAMHAHFDEIFLLFDWLLETGVQPDGVAFTTILTACSHGGRVEEGKGYFQMMTERYQIRPTIEHYTCMVDMLGRAGRIEEAKEVVGKMDIEPDDALWRALFAACRIHKESDIRVRGRYYEFSVE